MAGVTQAQTVAPLFRLESGSGQTPLFELYTSEGCSSCPPAEQWLSALVNNPDLWREFVPVAFHVDYWDHLGWRDRFGSPAYSLRQRTYAATWRTPSVYTPGFVWNGSEWRGWFQGQALPSSDHPPAGNLTVTWLAGPQWTVAFAPTTAQPRIYVAHLVLLGFGLASTVTAGENKGRVLHHDFVALTLASVGAHAPRTLRHYSVVYRRVMAD